MRRRSSGILLHLTSLPSAYGVGDIGPEAHRFADFLSRAGQSAWQILPVGPTSPAIGNSPYSSSSAFAGNPLLLSPELLARDGYIPLSELTEGDGHTDRADYEAAERLKNRLCLIAFERCRDDLADDPGFARFRADNACWLDDYALFATLKNHFGGQPWNLWPEGLRDRDPEALRAVRETHDDAILYETFVQYLFHLQWRELRRVLADKSVMLIGDMPIYVTYDSADVWANTRFFKLGPDKNPTHVAGVPPDYFSKTGQLWGNPVFDWNALASDGFRWWVGRMARALALHDYVRIDHFRGFAAYWEIKAGEKTAINGTWVEVPGVDFFDELSGHFPTLPIIAEDLGIITADVRELRDDFDMPGMRVLQFAFSEPTGKTPHSPHNHPVHSVAYTGTHDNNTTRGWFTEELSPQDRERLFAYQGYRVNEADAPWALLRLAMASPARLCMAPMQDILALGPQARMNTPAQPGGNWRWRMTKDAASGELAARLRAMTELFGRR